MKAHGCITAFPAAPDNLENLPEEHRRGLTLDTLKLHHCRYDANWTTVEARLAGVPNATPTPRLIIPAGNHYLARLAVPLEIFKNAPDFPYIKDKPHVVDAMSLNQVFGTDYRIAIATCGAAVGKDIAREIFDKLESIFAIANRKPFILILFDNDATGEREGAKFCAECIKRGYPAIADFYSDGDEKVDANSILQKSGDEGLRQATNEITRRNSDKFNELVKTIAEKAVEEVLNPSALFISDEHYQKIFRDIAGVNDLANANRFAFILKFLLGDRVRYLSDCDRWANYNSIDGTWHINSNSRNTALTHHRKYSSAITAMKYDERITISTEDFDRHKNVQCQCRV